MLPFVAGFVIQTNSIADSALLLSFIPFILSYLEIRLSRPYKTYKRKKINLEKTRLYEKCLKILSLGTIFSTTILFVLKIIVF
ncbi:MAG TPA: hypothetical protein VEQ18_02175 [Candidatus Nitrosocosmicus sp.]|nr:hypothetical protein [Candidatus Nitrosocosmicus sp.]